MKTLEEMVDKMLAKETEEEPNGVFIADMTEQEYKDYQHLEVKGWKKIYDKS